jgi:hypothetical protein
MANYNKWCLLHSCHPGKSQSFVLKEQRVHLQAGRQGATSSEEWAQGFEHPADFSLLALPRAPDPSLSIVGQNKYPKHTVSNAEQDSPPVSFSDNYRPLSLNPFRVLKNSYPLQLRVLPMATIADPFRVGFLLINWLIQQFMLLRS